MKSKNKKGTHMGVIISFVIFVAFIVFLIVILNPSAKMKNTGKQTIDSLEIKIKNYVSAEITSFILSPPQASSNCFTLNESSYNLSEFNVSVRNQDNVLSNIYREPNYLYIEKSVPDTMYKVDYSPNYLYSDSFSNPNNCKDLIINSIRKTNKILEPKIISLIEEQDNDYLNLKQTFNIPSEKEFGIGFEFENSTIIGKPVPEKKKSTYVKKFQVIYLDVNAQEKVGNFITYII